LYTYLLSKQETKRKASRLRLRCKKSTPGVVLKILVQEKLSEDSKKNEAARFSESPIFASIQVNLKSKKPALRAGRCVDKSLHIHRMRCAEATCLCKTRFLSTIHPS
jgi:hypothetical protein